MTNRTNECYSAVFKYIEDNIFKLEPDEIITDFEAGMRLSIRNCFPRAILRGCWYHYCAKIREKFSKLGLSSLLKNNENAKLIKYELMNLPLLPSAYFMDGYNHIRQFTRSCGLAAKLGKMFEYFEYWIQEVSYLH